MLFSKFCFFDYVSDRGYLNMLKAVEEWSM